MVLSLIQLNAKISQKKGIVEYIEQDTEEVLELDKELKEDSLDPGQIDNQGLQEDLDHREEIEEEINLDPSNIKGIREVGQVIDKKIFHVFVGFVDKEFKPNLKLDENDDYGWFNSQNLPSPIHKRWGNTFQLVKPLLNLRKGFKKFFNG